MSKVEEYYKERCEVLESKILSLLKQAEINQECNAMHEIEYRKEVKFLKQEKESLQQDCEKFVYHLTSLVYHMDRFGKSGDSKRIYGSDDLTMLYEKARAALFNRENTN